MVSEKFPVIDVHHHILPPMIKATLLKETGSNFALPDWSLQQDRETMERLGITGVLFSFPSSGTSEQVRQLNTLLAETSREDPRSYGFLANLPYEDTEAALHEIEYAFDTLHADGFTLPSNYRGIYLSDERMEEILAGLHRRKAVVFVHPNLPAGNNLPLFGRDPSVYEFTFDTTRAVMDLLYTGKLARYSQIRWILAHAGGTIPYLSYRLSRSAEIGTIPQTTEEVIALLQSLYYELAISTSPAVYQAVRGLAGTSHMLFGSDFPMRHASGIKESLEEVFSYPGFSSDEQRQIAFQTAQSLFPRFSQNT